MDLDSLENKLNDMGGSQEVSSPFSPSSQTLNNVSGPTASNPFISRGAGRAGAGRAGAGRAGAGRAGAGRAGAGSERPVSVTKKINQITDEDVSSYSEKVIPNWKDLQAIYEGQWQKEKEKFQTHLKANFAALVERFASGKQELFQLVAPERREKLYVEAFLELFESGYAPHVGDVERIANKRVRKLYITLPNNYSSIY